MQQEQTCGPCNKQQLQPKERQQLQQKLLQQLLVLCEEPDEAKPNCCGRKQGQNRECGKDDRCMIKKHGGCKRPACRTEGCCSDSVRVRAVSDILSRGIPKDQSVNLSRIRQIAGSCETITRQPLPTGQLHHLTHTELYNVLGPHAAPQPGEPGPPRTDNTLFHKEYVCEFPQHEAEKTMSQRVMIAKAANTARDALAKACVRIGKMDEVSAAEQQSLLDELRSRLFTLNQQYHKLPVAEDTPWRKNRRRQMEQQLNKLERYIELLEKTWPLYIAPE